MKKLKFSFYTVLMFFFLVSSIYAGKTVEGIGVAAGEGEGAQKEALSKALRNAIERALGVMVSSESLVKNFQLIEDTIYSNVDGYVTNYEILEDNKGEGGITRIKVKAEVENSKLENDLRGIKVILEAKGNPKTMVLINESFDGDPYPLISSSIEDYLNKKTFPLVDRNQIALIKEEDSKDLANDPEKAKILGARYGAELLITGVAEGRMGSINESYGVKVYSCSSTLNIKAVSSDTGALLSVLSGTETAHSGNPEAAAEEAVKKVWDKNKENFFKEIMEKFRTSVLNDTEITFIISKCSPQSRIDLKKRLAKINGITKVFENSYKTSVMELNVFVEGTSAKNIDEKIYEEIPELLLVTKTGNRIDFEVQEKTN